MGWLSRSKKPQDAPLTAGGADDSPGGAPVPAAPVEPQQQPGEPASTTPMGKYGPQVSITHFDTAPDELTWQLPINGELYRVIPGPDRPDYSVMLLERPLHVYPGKDLDLARVDQDLVTQDRRGRTMVRAHAVVVCARFAGQQLGPGMSDLPVNIATVTANSVLKDAQLDFAKISYAAVGFLSEGHRENPPQPHATGSPESAESAESGESGESADQSPEQPSESVAGPVADTVADTLADTVAAAPEPTASGPEPTASGPASEATPPVLVVSTVCNDVAATLRQGIIDQRGTAVTSVHARLTLDAQHRVSGLSGNADGGPPVPTPETFEKMNASLAKLAQLPPGNDIVGITVRIDGADVSHQVDYAVT